MMTKKTQLVKNEPSKAPATRQNPPMPARTTPSSNITPANNAIALKESLTRVVIKYDIGFSNTLYIRGKGANLSWDKGIPLNNTKNDEWVWETDLNFQNAEFKVLINDKIYEAGYDHTIQCGSTIQYTPQF
jgi:hypothetical protein